MISLPHFLPDGLQKSNFIIYLMDSKCRRKFKKPWSNWTPFKVLVEVNLGQSFENYCVGGKKIWICGDDGKITQINKSRIILKTFETSGNVIGLAYKLHQELVLIVVWSDPVIYKIICDRVVAHYFNLHNWLPTGFCHKANGDFLISMRSIDKKGVEVFVT